MQDFGRVERFLVGAIGEPGKRTFYLFIQRGGLPIWFKCEKGQAAALGEQGLELLSKLGWTADDDETARMVADAGTLPAPAEVEDVLLAVRSIALRVDSRERMTLMLEGVGREDPIVFTVTSDQLRVAAILSLEAVHSGRAQCPDCLLPEDPEGHYCPSGNGHRPGSG